MDPITAIATAIGEASKAIGIWMASNDRKRMENALHAAEQYIFVSEGSGEYANLPTKKVVELTAYWRKRFFKYNE